MTDMTPIPAPSLGKLAKALAAAQSQMKPAAKDANNPHFKSKYADLEAVNEAARVLAIHGIAVMCVPDGWNENRIVIRAMLVHESGEMMEGRLEVPVSQPNNPQALGSAMTYGRRYAVSALANIATSDDDGNAAAERGGDATIGRADLRNERPRNNSEPRQIKPEAPPAVDVGKTEAMQQRAAAKASSLIDVINEAATLADASRALLLEGLQDIDGSEWMMEEKSVLAALKRIAPNEFQRIQDAYNRKRAN